MACALSSHNACGKLPLRLILIEHMSVVQKLNLDEIVQVNADLLHGTPCFTGTRVPVQTLLDYIAESDTLDAFLADFPSVKREQATGLLALAQERLVESLSSR